jgi:hypothetical protein
MQQPLIQGPGGPYNPAHEQFLSNFENIRLIKMGRSMLWLGTFQLVWFLLFMLFSIIMLLGAVVCVPLICCGIYGVKNCRK